MENLREKSIRNVDMEIERMSIDIRNYDKELINEMKYFEEKLWLIKNIL